MINIFIDKQLNKINIVTDDPSIKYYLEVTRKERKFIPWKKSFGELTTTIKIYDKKTTKSGIVTYTLGLGWAGYIINVFSPYITKETYDSILRDAIYVDEAPRDIPFPELRDYQNEDILHILKYKRGLLNVYTSYGKNLPLYVEIHK